MLLHMSRIPPYVVNEHCGPSFTSATLKLSQTFNIQTAATLPYRNLSSDNNHHSPPPLLLPHCCFTEAHSQEFNIQMQRRSFTEMCQGLNHLLLTSTEVPPPLLLLLCLQSVLCFAAPLWTPPHTDIPVGFLSANSATCCTREWQNFSLVVVSDASDEQIKVSYNTVIWTAVGSRKCANGVSFETLHVWRRSCYTQIIMKICVTTQAHSQSVIFCEDKFPNSQDWRKKVHYKWSQ